MSVNMCKHKLSLYLDNLSESERKKSMASGRKFSKVLKRKHTDAVKDIRERKKIKLQENERRKNEKQIMEKEREVNLLTDLLNQGGLCTNKEDLKRLMAGPKALENLKVQIRFRKH